MDLASNLTVVRDDCFAAVRASWLHTSIPIPSRLPFVSRVAQQTRSDMRVFSRAAFHVSQQILKADF